MTGSIEPESTLVDYSIVNELTINNLFVSLTQIYSKQNVLILDRSLSRLINFLTPFLKLKEKGNIDTISWLDSNDNEEVLNKFGGVVVLMQESDENLDFISRLAHSNKRLNVIIKNLSKSYCYELNKRLSGLLSFDSFVDNKLSKFLKITPTIKVINWECYPIYTSDIFSLEAVNGGLTSYFKQPLEQVHYLSEAFMTLLANSKLFTPDKNYLKLKNIYAKGNTACLLSDVISKRLPDFLNSLMNPLEKQFYEETLRGNTDLVILERNLDISSVVFNQLTYHGLIDDFFDIDIDNVQLEDEKFILNDELYNEIKHLNFATIGKKLNSLAKYIQLEFQNKDSAVDLDKMKKLASSLGTLTQKQELVKKHTYISESILDIIKLGALGSNSTNPIHDHNERFLEFENDLFEMDYKTLLSHLKQFLHENYELLVVFSTIILISITNDGIRDRDFEWIYEEVYENYGLTAVIVLKEMKTYKLINITTEDFLSALTGLKTNSKKEESNIHDSELENLGITGALSVYKSNYTLINKFWNLHPIIEDDVQLPQLQSNNLIDEYAAPSFTLPAGTVPLLSRLVEALYFRDFLKYKPTNNLSRRPNWNNLGLETMFRGQMIDTNLCDKLDDRNHIPSPKQEYVVFIAVGGITRAEISCMKYLEQRFEKAGKNKKIIVLSSGIVKCSSLLHVLTN